MTEEKRAKYAHVNDQWPDTIPSLDPQEALAAAKRLYRVATGRAFQGKWALTSGRRYTWPRRGVYYVNPGGHHFGGWRDLVHDISHRAHWVLHRHAKDYKPHDHRHHFLERELVAHVLKAGWLDGRLKRPAKTKPDAKRLRAARIAARLKAWEAKRKRAETALRKLRRQAAYYERQLAA
jgi:hypothetical protein